MTQRCIFVALLGAPNAGKSTLINRLVGSKVSIVSPKVQTTRSRIRGVFHTGDAQVVLVDTPGIFEPKRTLEKAIVQAAWQGLEETDAAAVLVDARRGLCKDTKRIIDGLKQQGKQAILLLNKVDSLSSPEALLPLSQQLFDTGVFSKVFMISALNGEGVEEAKKHFAEIAPEGPWMYPPEQVSDMPLKLFMAEVTREALFHALRQELPYSVAVETEQLEELAKGGYKVHQVIYVQKEAHKQILLGKKGAFIKEVSMNARTQLSTLLKKPVHLFLFVKVKPDWQDRREIYEATGMDFPQ